VGAFMSNTITFPQRLSGPYATPYEAPAQVEKYQGDGFAFVFDTAGAFHVVVLPEKKIPKREVLNMLSAVCKREGKTENVLT
jgi:hypothetical protein